MYKIFKNLITTAVAIPFLLVTLGFTGLSTAQAAAAPNLGVASGYSVFGNAGITETLAQLSHLWGNAGGNGFGNASLIPSQVDGTIDAGANAPVVGAISTAYGNLAGEAQTGSIDLALSPSVGPGVYNVGASAFSSTLTLSGAGVYIFRSTSSIAQTAGGTMLLTNGACASNVFWQIPNSMTFAAAGNIEGTIITNTGLISFVSGVNLKGRAWAATQVTMNNNQITQPICAPPLATLHVVKLVVNGSTGTAVPANFNLHVKLAGVDVALSPQLGAAAPGTLYSLAAGTYVVSEDAKANYAKSFSGACDSSGSVTLLAGQDYTCTVINTNVPTPIIVGSSDSGVYVSRVIGLLKVPSPLVLTSGAGPITYNYTVWNVAGAQALTSVSVTDDKCSPLVFLSGDLNGNGKLDANESWKYSCTATLSKTTTNTSIAIGYSDDSYHQAAIATAVATVVVGGVPLSPPLINIVKVPNRLTPFPFGGGQVLYSYIVTNPGVIAMHDIIVTDDKCSPVSRIIGDETANGNNNNGLLDPGESWAYTCRTNISTSTRNVASVEGKANGFTALGYAFANVFVSTPVVSSPKLPNTGFPPSDTNTPWNIAIMVGVLMIVSTSIVVAIKRRKI